MDQATATTTMDSRKPVARSVQLGSKAPNSSDANREVCKRPYGGARRQRDLERDSLVGGGGGGLRGKAYGGPGKAGAGARSANKVNRNKEKESKQVRGHGLVSLDHYDDEEYYDGSERLRRPPQHLGGDSRPYRNSADYGGYGERRGGKKPNKRCGSSASYKTHTNERCFQARCQFLVNYKKEAEVALSAAMPVGFTPSVAAQPNAGAAGSLGTACPPAGDADAGQKGLLESVEAALRDPDALVSWGSVEEVLLHTTEPFNCPVCLYPPVAPQVTRCGHIYCYPCILHYLALSDKKWRGCPICNLMVVREDLKSVAFVVHKDYRVGTSIQMRLMSRHRDSAVPAPVQRGGLAPLPANMFCRTMQANAQKVMAIIERERTALEVQMMTEGSEPEACFIEQALTLINERQQNLPDFGAEIITSKINEMTLSDDPEALERGSTKRKQESDSKKIGDGFKTSGNEPKMGVNDPEICVDQQTDSDKTGSNSATTLNTEQKEALESETRVENVLENQERDRKFSGSSAHSGTSESEASLPITRSVSFPLAACATERLRLCRSKEDSDETSSVSSSLTDAPVDVVSPDPGSVSDGFGSLSPTETLPSNAEAASVVAFDNSSGNVVVPPAECLQFDLEEETHDKAATAVKKKKQKGAEPPKSMYYFYQADDGSNVYLQPLNFAMLAREFGGAANCPATISANIVEMEYGTITDRAMMQGNRKFLCHLPLCCCYELVELDLRGFLSPQTLESFKSTLDWRENVRAQRAKKEELIELRNREKEEKEFSRRLFQYVKSAYTGPLVSTSDVPDVAAAEFNEENYPAMGPSSGRPYRQSTSSDGQSSPSLATSPPQTSSGGARAGRKGKQQQQQQISFAKVLTTQTPNKSVRPRPAWGETVPPSPASTASVWGNPSSSGGGSGAPARSATDADDEDDESRFSAPDFKHAYSMSWDAMLTSALNASPNPGSGGKKNKKGKKKMKPVVVMASGGGY